jgi:hypothetical protein
MRVKHFFKTLAILAFSLVALAASLNAALDRAARAPSQNSFTMYDESGRTLYAYSGTLHDPILGISKGGIFVYSSRPIRRT